MRVPSITKHIDLRWLAPCALAVSTFPFRNASLKPAGANTFHVTESLVNQRFIGCGMVVAQWAGPAGQDSDPESGAQQNGTSRRVERRTDARRGAASSAPRGEAQNKRGVPPTSDGTALQNKPEASTQAAGNACGVHAQRSKQNCPGVGSAQADTPKPVSIQRDSRGDKAGTASQPPHGT